MTTGKKYSYFFGRGKADGHGAMKDLLGGKAQREGRGRVSVQVNPVSVPTEADMRLER